VIFLYGFLNFHDLLIFRNAKKMFGRKAGIVELSSLVKRLFYVKKMKKLGAHMPLISG